MEASQPSPMLLLYFSNHSLSMAISIAPMRSTTDPVANGAPSDLPAVHPSSDSDPADRILDGESGQDGEGAPFLPPIPEQEGVAPDEVIPTGPGSEGYAAVAARDPNEEKQAEPQRPNYPAVSEGSPDLDLGSSEDTSDHRQREEELSAKIRPKAKPLRLPKVCTTTKHMQIFPPSHPIPSLLGMVSCFWIDGFHPTCGGQEVRRDGAKYVELFLSDSCSVQFISSVPTILTHYCMFMYR